MARRGTHRASTTPEAPGGPAVVGSRFRGQAAARHARAHADGGGRQAVATLDRCASAPGDGPTAGNPAHPERREQT